MQRDLTFTQTDLDRKYFALLYEGFVVGGTLFNTDREQKPFDQRRREGKIARKLKAISHESDDDLPTRDKGRMLNNGGPQTLALEQAEHDLLVKYIERTPWKPNLMDDVSDMMDALNAAEKRAAVAGET